MKMNSRTAAAILAALPMVLAAVEAPAAESRTKVLATTFPMYMLTKTVVEGDAGVSLELLLSPNLGCPHSYVVTPQDMRRIGAADVIVFNGLGLDNAIVAAQTRAAGGRARLIDSSAGLSGMNYSDDDEGHGKAAGHEGHAGERHDHEDHDHEGVNPHMFASPLMAAKIARNIADSLAEVRPASAALYKKNADAFDARMRVLNTDFAAAVKKLKNRRIVTQHGAFDYLARDVGLEIATVIEAHPGTEPSAAEMMKLVRTIRATRAGGVFVEPQYPQRVPKTIADEAGIHLGTLDPVATGPAGSDGAYYEKMMRQNILNLEKTLGTR